MVDLSLITISIVMIFLALRLTWVAAGNSIVFTPVAIYLIIFILFHYPLYFFIDAPKWEYLIVLNFGLLFFLLGVLAPLHRKKLKAIRAKQLSTVIFNNASSRVYKILLFLIFITMLFYFRGFPPTFNIFLDIFTGKDVTDSLLQMSGFRRELTKSHYFGGEYRGQGIFKLIHEIGWQLIVTISFVTAILTKKKISIVFFLTLFFVGSISLFGTGVKGPVGWLVIILFISSSLIFRLKPRKVLYFSLVLMALVIIMMALQPSRYEGSNVTFSAVTDAVVHRFFIGNGKNSYEIITRIIEGQFSLKYGYEHLTVFMNSLPGIQFDKPFASELFFIINPEASTARTTYATYTYLGTMYLDFGLLGVLLFSFLTGFVLQYTYFKVIAWRPSVISISFSAILIQKLGAVVVGNLLSLGPSALVLFAYYIAIKLFGNRTFKHSIS